MNRHLAAGLTVLAGTILATAQEPSEIEKKQIAFAESALAKVGIEKPVIVETEGFRFIGTISKDKATALSKSLGKYVGTSAKLAHYKDDEKPWLGKPTVFFIAERTKYANFVRNNEERRAESDEKSSMNVKGETPYVAISTEGVKPAEMEAKLIEEFEDAVLTRKVGGIAKFPVWFLEGFHKLVSLKTVPANYAQFRNNMKAKFGPKGIWYGMELRYATGELYPTDRKMDAKDELIVRASFVDYLLNGVPESKADAALNSFRITDEMPMPGTMGLAALVDVKEGESWATKLETGWKSWYVAAKETPKKDPKSKN